MTSSARSIVIVSSILPVTGGNGLAMRTSMFAQAAGQVGDTLCIVFGHNSALLRNHPLPHNVSVCEIPVEVDTRLSLITETIPAAHRAQALLDYGRPSISVALSAGVMNQIVQKLKHVQPDLVIISRAYTLPLLEIIDRGEQYQTPVVVDLDDDDAALHLSFADDEERQGNLILADWHRAEATIFDNLISTHADRIRLLWAAGRQVEQSLRSRLNLTNVQIAANAVDLVEHAATTSDQECKNEQVLLFVGNLSYKPNHDGICWFFTHIWPLLRAEVRKIKIVIAGSNCPADVRKHCQHPDIKLIENPIDLGSIYHSATAAIVPLRFGSGSRLKILEAGAYGLPVISTDAGARGLTLSVDDHLFQSPVDVFEFGKACIACLSSPDEAKRRSGLLRKFVSAHHDRKNVVEKLRHDIVDSLDT